MTAGTCDRRHLYIATVTSFSLTFVFFRLFALCLALLFLCYIT